MKILLFPFSILYGLITYVRNLLFDIKILKSKDFKVTVISVGNLCAGGSGKTPHIEYLIRLLKEKYKLAVLSRGYMRETSGFLLGNDKSTFESIGDEPMQFLNKFNNIYVAVDEDRCEGIEELLNYDSKIKVVLLDDAFQHRYVKPRLSILLTDYSNLYVDDLMIPSGTLREFACGAKRADVIIITKTPKPFSPIERRYIEDKIKIRPHQKIFFSYLNYSNFIPLSKKANDFKIDKIHTIILFAGIANPYPLEEFLQRKCEECKLIQFPDHYKFEEIDIEKIKNKYLSVLNTNKIIVTTEKDAMRLLKNSIFDKLKDIPVFYISIEIDFHYDKKSEFNSLIINNIEH